MKRLVQGRFRGNASAHELYKFLGVSSLPVEGMPERLIQGVRVYVKPLPHVEIGPRPTAVPYPRPPRNFQLRVMAICECGRHLPVGRLTQHKCKEPK